jgi:4-amino-4-deoxy-L-arabinose transferase-like glycosyltransferase
MSWKNELTNNALLSKRERFGLAALFICAFVARALWGLGSSLNIEGGDSPFYLELAKRVFTGELSNTAIWAAVGPLYPYFLSLFYFLVPTDLIISTVRIAQSFLDSLLCLVVFDSTRLVFNKRAGFIAAILLTFDPRFILQSSDIATESLFTFLLALSLWLFIRTYRLAQLTPQQKISGYLGATILGLLAAFTRPIALPIPLLLLLLLLLPRPTRTQFILVSLLIAGAFTIVIGWGWYKYQTAGNFVIISEGLTGNFWIGSHGDGQWHGFNHFTNEISELAKKYNGRYAYFEDALATIMADPPAYLKLLALKFTRAYLQPHGTVGVGTEGQSLKEILGLILSGKQNILTLLTAQDFSIKLVIYIFHFTGLLGGLAGIYLSRNNLLKIAPLVSPIVYFTVAYTLLTIIPRYLFPIMLFYLIFAAYALEQAYARLNSRT